MKKFTFSNTTPLTADHFNSFVQESQIMQGTGDSKTDVMSQAAVTNALRSLGYSDNDGYGYGYGYDSAVASKGICVHAKGKVDGNVIVVCAENVLNTVTLGTTVTLPLLALPFRERGRWTRSGRMGIAKFITLRLTPPQSLRDSSPSKRVSQGRAVTA